jgi:hypothetical protein
VYATNDGGYVTAGMTFNGTVSFFDPYLMKYDASGNLLWQKVYAVFASFADDLAYSMQQTADNGYILSGYTLNFGAGEHDAFLMKTDTGGNIVWQIGYGGSDTDIVYSVIQTTDGGYMMAGYTKSFGAGQEDVYAVRVHANGTLAWAKAYGSIGSDFGKAVQQTADGGFVIAGYTTGFGAGAKDVYVIKIDSSGAVEWSQTFGGSQNDEGMSVQSTADGGYIATGYTESFGSGQQDVYLIKLDSTGASGCNENTAATLVNSTSTQLSSGTFVASSGIIILNYPTEVDTAGSEVQLCSVIINEPTQNNAISVYPNPAHSSFAISWNEGLKIQIAELKIFDVMGRVVYEQKLNGQSTIIDKQFSPGIYFIKVAAGEKVLTLKLAVE